MCLHDPQPIVREALERKPGPGVKTAAQCCGLVLALKCTKWSQVIL